MAKTHYLRITIPGDDPKAYEWCRNQRRNLSLALRILIHEQIRRKGEGNIFATTDEETAEPEPKPKKRRAPKPKKKVQQTAPKNSQQQNGKPGKITDKDLERFMMN